MENVDFGVQKLSLKWGKIGPSLMLKTNRKSHTHFRLVPKSTTWGGPEGSLFTLFQNTCTRMLLLIYIILHSI